MPLFHAVILGVVEGITEFLPISSTGHLILASKLLAIPQTEFVKSFEIAIQLGAILSVVVLFWRKLFVEWEVIKRVAAAFIPTAVVGLILYKFIKQYLFSDVIVVWTLLLGGVALIVFEEWRRGKEEWRMKYEDGGMKKEERQMTSEDSLEAISYKQAVLIGLAQSVAVIPGVSRAAATILGGMALGIKRQTIVEFSFLLAVPTMAAATGLDLLKSSASFSSGEFGALAVGFVVSFLVAIAAIRWLLNFIETHDFTAFGWYRIVVAALFWLFVLR